MDQSMILNLFGGVSQDGLGWTVDYDKLLYELARWLLPIAVCLLAEGIWLEKKKNIELFSCFRCVTVKKWWRRKFVRGLMKGVLTEGVLWIMAVAADLARTGRIPVESWKVFILWSVHMTTILSFLLVLDLAGLGKPVPAILLLLEGFTFLAGFSDRRIAYLMYGMRGMYFQSKWHLGEAGVSVLSSLAAEMALIALSYLIGEILLERKGVFVWQRLSGLRI